MQLKKIMLKTFPTCHKIKFESVSKLERWELTIVSPTTGVIGVPSFF